MMVLYQSLTRNLFRALCNLSVSVLLLLASVLAKAAEMPAGGTGGGMLGIGIPRNGRAPARSCSGAAGRGSQISASLPRCAMRGRSRGPSPQTLLPTGC